MDHRRISTIRLVGLATGLFAVQTYWGFTWSVLPLFLKKLAGSNIATGILLSIAGGTGVILPVLSGMLSDRVATPWGRRKPFIAAGWFTVCIALLLLPRATSLAAVLPLLILAFAGFFTTMGPYFALLPDIVPPRQRSTASGVMFLVGGLGMLSYLLCAARYFETSPRLPFWWAVGGIVLATAVMFASVKEPPTSATPARSARLFSQVLRDRNILIFYSGMILWWIGLWIVSAFFIIATMAIFQVKAESAVRAFFIFNVCFVLSALPAGMLGARFGLKRITALGLLALAASLLATPLIGDFAAVMPFLAVAGAAYGIVLVVAYAFFLSLIPADNNAGYTGIYMACQNGTLLIGPAIGGFAVDHCGYAALFVCAALFVGAGMTLLLAVREAPKK